MTRPLVPPICEIRLQHGQVALVDAEDFPRVCSYRWYARRNRGNVYVVRDERREDGRFHYVRMHRVIINAPEGVEVDHVNGDGRDNRRENLRLCSRRENLRNQHKIIGAVPFKGVTGRPGDNTKKRFTAMITVYSKRIYLGIFVNPEDAARAYDAAALTYFGEFARTNHDLGLLSEATE